MADDVLIRLLLDAAQLLQEGGKAEEAFDRLAEAADHVTTSGTSLEDTQAALDEALRRTSQAAEASTDAVGGLGAGVRTLTSRFAAVASVANNVLGVYQQVLQVLRDLDAAHKLVLDVVSGEHDVIEKLLPVLERYHARESGLVAVLRERAAASRQASEAIADATTELERQEEADRQFLATLGLVREEHQQFAKDLERQLKLVGDNEAGIEALVERAREYRENLQELGVRVYPELIDQVANLTTAEDKLQEVIKLRIETAKKEQDRLAESIKALTAEAETFKSLEQSIGAFADGAVADLQRVEDKLREVFEAQQQGPQESEAFRDQQEALADLRAELEALEGLTFRTPEELDRTLQLQTQIAELEKQRVEQFEDSAQASEDSARRQAEAMTELQGFVDGARAQVEGLASEYDGLDAASRRTLDLIISNFERELTLTDDVIASTERFKTEFSDALETAREKAESAFTTHEEGAKKAREEQEKLKEETKGLAEETRQAAENSEKATAEMERLIAKYGDANLQAERLKTNTSETLAVAQALAATIGPL